jgi:predicted phosphodiesterase
VRYLILSDTHANWYALEAVLTDAEGKYDQTVCCGDLVGYNPAPGAVIDWTQKNCSAVVRGNHDKAISGIDNLEWFNDVAKTAAVWTTSQLSGEQLDYLRGLQQGPSKLEHFHIWHGSPRDEDEYINSPREALPACEYLEISIGFFGHTHVQGIFFSKHRRLGALPSVPRSENQFTVELEPDVLYIVNAGSVGQPRDGDPRAAYALYDTAQKTVSLRRVRYAVENTALDIKKAGLPDVLAQRLFYGF